MDQSKRIIEIAEAYIPTSDLMTLLYKRRKVAQKIKAFIKDENDHDIEAALNLIQEFMEIEAALKAHLRLAQ